MEKYFFQKSQFYDFLASAPIFSHTTAHVSIVFKLLEKLYLQNMTYQHTKGVSHQTLHWAILMYWQHFMKIFVKSSQFTRSYFTCRSFISVLTIVLKSLQTQCQNCFHVFKMKRAKMDKSVIATNA